MSFAQASKIMIQLLAQPQPQRVMILMTNVVLYL